MKKILPIVALAFALTTNVVSAKTAGTVNGMVITVEEANTALNTLTQGKKTWDTLEADAKKQLIEMMAPAKLVAAESKKSLTEKEKEAALAGFWMQKKISTTPVTDKEAKEAYEKMKKMATEAKSTQKIPEFEVIKNSIKMQLSQEKVVAELMKNAKVIIK